jgi:glycosyltransferase involved in cell wall biosynthesis
MEQLGFRKNKLHVIYNSLSYRESFKLRGKLKSEPIFKNHFHNDDPVLTFIGRITKGKKLELLISAQKILMNRGFKCNVALIGESEAFTELQSQVRENKQIDRYWFLGPIYDEIQLSKLLFNSEICISPGNVGLTAIHAFSYGLPVITNDNYDLQGPEHEIIDDAVTGMFFKEDSPESLASKIEWWIDSKKDRENIRRLCYEKIDNFYNPISQVKIFESVLNGISN